jgi:hypothetical protein
VTNEFQRKLNLFLFNKNTKNERKREEKLNQIVFLIFFFQNNKDRKEMYIFFVCHLNLRWLAN